MWVWVGGASVHVFVYVKGSLVGMSG